MVKSKTLQRKKRHLRVRKKISGTKEVPRLCVFKSNSHFYAQVINDVDQKTLAASSSLALKIKNSGNMDAVQQVAKDLATKMSDKKIKKIVFDRNGYVYHGKVKKFSEIIREAGIII